MKSKHCLILILFVCCGINFPEQAWSQTFQDTGLFSFTGSHNPLRRPILREFLPGDGVKVGRFQIHPFFGVAEIFTDNAFRVKDKRQSDFLTTIAPGIQAYRPFGGQHSLLLDYRAAQFLHAKFSENNAFAQHAVGQLKLQFPGRLEIYFQGGHVEGFDPRGSNLDSRNDNITKWRSENFFGQASLRSSRARVRLRSLYTRRHFKNNGQDAPRDRKTIRADVTGFLQATNTVAGLLGVTISNFTYDENKQLDSFSYGGFTGIELAPDRQLSGLIRVGYSILTFDRAPKDQPDGSDLSRGGTQQERLTFNGRLNWRPTTQQFISVRPFRNIRQSGVENQSTFVQTGVSLIANHRFTDRLELRTGFLYSKNDFEGSRRDNRYRWRMGLDYRTVQWLGFGVNYYFSKRSSTDDNFDFYSNTISVAAQALF